MALSKECENFCKLLAEEYSGNSDVVTINPEKRQIDPNAILSYFHELKANGICNPKSHKCFMSSDIAFFDLTDKGKNYLRKLKR